MKHGAALPEVAGNGNFANHTVPTEQLAHQSFNTVGALAEQLQPSSPVHIFRPHVARRVTRWFVDHFPGRVLYAVKTNPAPYALQAVYDAGVRQFDVASLAEIELIHRMFPEAGMAYMHPVKSREAIFEAYHRYGVRDFAIDCFEELHKILAITNNARDLGLHIRLALPKGSAAHDLSGKFGASADEAVELLKLARKVAHRVGICFHVGSQCMDPSAYTRAMAQVADVVTRANIRLDVVDVGGGFPSIYPGLTPPPMADYLAAIAASMKMLGDQQPELWCEPGRALVAEAGSVLVRVELRKKQALYLNDGTYGSLFDAGFPGMIFPTRLVRGEHPDAARQSHDEDAALAYSFFGPTCDSLDAMKGPFMLPNDIVEGDWIEVGQLGAYGAALQTKFNGFYSDHHVMVKDEPVLSYFPREATAAATTVPMEIA